ncbi:hypothetical protein [Luteococcus sediminum]
MSMRAVENARLTYRRAIFGRGTLTMHLGRKTFELTRWTQAQRAAHEERQRHEPVLLCRREGKNYWQFQARIYSENEGLAPEQIRVLLLARTRRRELEIDRAARVA